MGSSPLDLCVLGVGHLAAAVRVQLLLFGLTVAVDHEAPRGTRRVILACSDYESESSFTDANRRAVRDRSAILFASISNRGRIEVGPLVVPLVSPCFECQATRRWDFSLNESTSSLTTLVPGAALNPDTGLRSAAHFGALLVAREVAALRLNASGARLVGRVAKFDPPCLFPEISQFGRVANCPGCGEASDANPASGG